MEQLQSTKVIDVPCQLILFVVGYFISSMKILMATSIVSSHLVRCIIVAGRRGSSCLSCQEDQLDLHHHQGGPALILYLETQTFHSFLQNKGVYLLLYLGLLVTLPRRKLSQHSTTFSIRYLTALNTYNSFNNLDKFKL